MAGKTLRIWVAGSCVALLAVACGDSGNETSPTTTLDPVAAAQASVSTAQEKVTKAQSSLESANAELCPTVESYISAIDRYGRIFTDSKVTVGDVQTLGKDLGEPRTKVQSAANGIVDARQQLATAQQALADAQHELAAAQAGASGQTAPSTAAASTTTTTMVPQATIDRVKRAEADFEQTAQGITASTPLVHAGVAFNSAAFELEFAWIKLFVDADCLTNDQQAHAAQQVYDYTVALQGQLQVLGLYTGAPDGIYGPVTVDAVKRLQADAGLPQTGLVDAATAKALDQKVAEKLGANSQQAVSQTAALQTILKLTGFWTGPVDGNWTAELTDALKAFQTKLGVPATGAVDAATLQAFQDALAKVTIPPSTTTTAASTTTAAR